MIGAGSIGWKRLRAIFLLAAVLIVGPVSWLSAVKESQPESLRAFEKSRPRQGQRLWHRLTEYSIKARVPVLGDIGQVGTFAIEEETRRDGDFLEKSFRIFGRSRPELAKKGKDYSGELEVVRTVPLEGEDGWEGPHSRESRDVTRSSSGYFNKNGAVEAERIVFFDDHAVSTRENGAKTRVEGQFGCLISAIEHFLECDIKAGDVHESRFVLGGRPLLFKCEVGRPMIIRSHGAEVFPIDFTTYDGVERDNKGMPKVVKKKGGIRLWLSKEEPFKNTYLRLTIQYKWYLDLQMEIDTRIRP